MLIKSCFQCEYHEIKKDGRERMSHCRRENCWSEYSKCVAKKALSRFFEQESTDHSPSFSTLSIVQDELSAAPHHATGQHRSTAAPHQALNSITQPIRLPGLKPGVCSGLILSGALNPGLKIGVWRRRTYQQTQ